MAHSWNNHDLFKIKFLIQPIVSLTHFLPAFHMSANTTMLPVVQVTNLEIIFDPSFFLKILTFHPSANLSSPPLIFESLSCLFHSIMLACLLLLIWNIARASNKHTFQLAPSSYSPTFHEATTVILLKFSCKIFLLIKIIQWWSLHIEKKIWTHPQAVKVLQGTGPYDSSLVPFCSLPYCQPGLTSDPPICQSLFCS